MREIKDFQNLLIAGTTGSGKSVLINSLLWSALKSNEPPKLALVDPKKIELNEYAKLPNCLAYGDDLDSIQGVLDCVCKAMDRRYEILKETPSKKWHGGEIWLVIDELGDLMTTDKRTFLPTLTHILQLARAANIKVIAGTQSPSRVVLPAQLQVCFTEQVCLRCRSAIESRQVIGETGGELLPKHGVALYNSADGIKRISIPMIDEVGLYRFLQEQRNPIRVVI